MDKEKLEQLEEENEIEEELPNDHSGFEHYCNHPADEDDTFIKMLLEAE